ncbi:MAG: hypothetical protein V2I33_24745 [Kangiellaceae bacterium]|jgi:hypothetical protein|nr:hypothetical protein [Kangiellaceae bacterium]
MKESSSEDIDMREYELKQHIEKVRAKVEENMIQGARFLAEKNALVENMISQIEEEERILCECWICIKIDNMYANIEIRDEPALENATFVIVLNG